MHYEATLPRKILVVDDEVPVRRMMERALADSGYVVLTAESAEQAMWLLAENEVDVLITDVVMRGMGGCELARHLRQVEPAFKVLFVSGCTKRQTGLKHEHNFLGKPFAPQELLDAVGQVLAA